MWPQPPTEAAGDDVALFARNIQLAIAFLGPLS
jgi:hypothetical protein